MPWRTEKTETWIKVFRNSWCQLQFSALVVLVFYFTHFCSVLAFCNTTCLNIQKRVWVRNECYSLHQLGDQLHGKVYQKILNTIQMCLIVVHWHSIFGFSTSTQKVNEDRISRNMCYENRLEWKLFYSETNHSWKKIVSNLFVVREITFPFNLSSQVCSNVMLFNKSHDRPPKEKT